MSACTTLDQQIQSGGAMGPTDRDFTTAAYSIAQLDEQGGKLAATKASDPRVVQLAGQMSSEAAVMYPNLRAAMRVQRTPQPTALSPETASALQELSTLSGPAFDRRFVAVQLAAHQRAVDAVKQEISTTKNTEMKSELGVILPALQQNLATLQILANDPTLKSA